MNEEQSLAENPFASLCPQDALKELGEQDNQIAILERQGKIATPEFIDLLQKRKQLCQVLNKLSEMNNCDTRIRFLQARMRGEAPVQTADIISLDRKRSRKKGNPVLVLGITGAIALLLVLVSIPILQSAISSRRSGAHNKQTAVSGSFGTVEELNRDDPGRNFNIHDYLKTGQITAFYFHSDDCPPCKALLPRYQDLARQRPDLRFYTLDIDRAGTQGIDFGSPLAQQYQLHSIPFIVIFDGYQEIARGRDAYTKLNEFANNSF